MALTVKNIQHVERTANIILDTIRNNPGISMKELVLTLTENKSFPHLKSTMMRRYIDVLHETGYIQKVGIHAHKYKLLNDTLFKYTPVAWNKPDRDRSKKK